MDSISRNLARFALSLSYDAIPERARNEAKRFLLDSIGCALAALDHEDMQQAYQYVKELGGSDQATIIGHGMRTNAPNAALMNALLVRAMDYNDISGPVASIGHHPRRSGHGGDEQCKRRGADRGDRHRLRAGDAHVPRCRSRRARGRLAPRYPHPIRQPARRRADARLKRGSARRRRRDRRVEPLHPRGSRRRAPDQHEEHRRSHGHRGRNNCSRGRKACSR